MHCGEINVEINASSLSGRITAVRASIAYIFVSSLTPRPTVDIPWSSKKLERRIRELVVTASPRRCARDRFWKYLSYNSVRTRFRIRRCHSPARTSGFPSLRVFRRRLFSWFIQRCCPVRRQCVCCPPQLTFDEAWRCSSGYMRRRDNGNRRKDLRHFCRDLRPTLARRKADPRRLHDATR
ncbi:hypothetical protein SCHPADRAFT_658307 [Schizopora paradoxa]|uniref:Uncharacterized protein n=1 Tax=Schizopora paradoxa TaxID=27342 RepID=A0A0H2RCJ3_9AGAM|nr:hypothetical protein SCHPADRAFT_658307 [Schizopora paradoxa]